MMEAAGQLDAALLTAATAFDSDTFASQLLSPTIVAIQLLLSVELFARTQPARPHRLPRLALIGAVTAAVMALGVAASSLLGSNQTRLVVWQGVLFCLVPVGLWLALMLCREATPLVALFCAVAAQTMQNLTSGLEGIMRILGAQASMDINASLFSVVIALVATTAVYLPCYLAFIRKLAKQGLTGIEDRGMLLVMLVVMLVTVIFDLAVKQLVLFDVPAAYVLALRAAHAAVCVFILYCMYEMLYNRRLQADVASMSRMLTDSERQYRLSRDSIEAINMKCHDLKHQIRELREGGAVVSDEVLGELEGAVGIYDAALRTGNEALDVILTEKALICERENITLSCIADGSALGFMAPADLYSLFGNALDNAIEAAQGISDNSLRSISLVVREAAGMAVVHMENYFAGELEFADGLPLTSKRAKDGGRDTLNHGYGTRSMRLLAERYGGTLAASAEGGEAGAGIFRLDIALPIPA